MVWESPVASVLIIKRRGHAKRETAIRAKSLGRMEVRAVKSMIPVLLFALMASPGVRGQSSNITSNQTSVDQEPAQKENRDGEAALIGSIKKGDVASVRDLLAGGVTPNARGEDGGSALLLAIAQNEREIIQSLLDSGANVNEKDEDGDTPLMIAGICGRAGIVQELLARGADVNAKDRGGHAVLLLTVWGAMMRSMPPDLLKTFLSDDESHLKKVTEMFGSEHTKIVQILLNKGADVNARASDCGMTALMAAAMSGDVEIVRILLGSDAKVNNEVGNGSSILGLMGKIDREIEEKKNEPDEDDQKILDWLRATAQSRAEVVRLLKEAGAN